jgi:hypothetical protein
MYNETKLAVKKAFDISKRLFFMGYENYLKLLETTSKVAMPTEKEVASYVEDGLPAEDAQIAALKEKYKQAAVEAGFTEDQGLAMLEYAAMLEEMKE